MSIGGDRVGVRFGGAPARSHARGLCALMLGAALHACGRSAQTTPAYGGAPTPSPAPAQNERTERGGPPGGAPPAVQGTARESDGTTQLAGTSNPASDRTPLATQTDECSADRDCACGVDRSTGACALGPTTRIDSNLQCPDFCTGITGQLHVVCERGRCVQQTAR